MEQMLLMSVITGAHLEQVRSSMDCYLYPTYGNEELCGVYHRVYFRGQGHKDFYTVFNGVLEYN